MRIPPAVRFRSTAAAALREERMTMSPTSCISSSSSLLSRQESPMMPRPAANVREMMITPSSRVLERMRLARAVPSVVRVRAAVRDRRAPSAST